MEISATAAARPEPLGLVEDPAGVLAVDDILAEAAGGLARPRGSVTWVRTDEGRIPAARLRGSAVRTAASASSTSGWWRWRDWQSSRAWIIVSRPVDQVQVVALAAAGQPDVAGFPVDRIGAEQHRLLATGFRA